jgi:PST family polysaccharide transporter
LEGRFVADSTVIADTLTVPEPPPQSRAAARAARKSYGKTAKVGALWAIGRESVTQILSIPTVVILARLLSPADFGIAAAATFFIQLGKRLGNMGLNTALVRMKDVREEHRASVFFINFAFGMLAWAVLMLAAPGIGAYYGDPRVAGALRLASTIFLVNFFGAVEQAVLQREMKFKEMAFVEWMTPVFYMPVSVGLAVAGWGYWSLVVGHLVANTASTCAKVYFGRWTPSFRVTRRGLAETLPFGMGVYSKRLLTYAAENLDSLIVGGLFGVTSLGFYDKAFNTAGKMSDRLALGSTVMFRIFAIIQEDRARFVRAYTKVVLAGTLVTLPAFAGLIVAAPQFIVVVFGEKWLPAVVPFQLLCGVGALRLMIGYASSAVQASGQIWGEVWRKIAQVLLIVGLIFALKSAGITGAALAVFLATLILTILMQGLVRRIVGLSWGEILTPIIPGLFAAAGTAAVVGAVTLGLRRVVPDIADWLLLICQASAAGVFWTLFTLLVRFPRVQEIVDEILDDVVPAAVRRQIGRVRRRPIRTTGV